LPQPLRPHHPDPTSGYYLIVPEESVTALEMSVEEAFKLIISGGMISPPDNNKQLRNE